MIMMMMKKKKKKKEEEKETPKLGSSLDVVPSDIFKTMAGEGT
jgi:hypothetical protein